MEIHFLRHIETVLEKGICYGQSEVTLPEGYKQTHQKIIDTLDTDYEQVYTSPLSRCRLLSEQITSHSHSDKRLMEVNFGDWELRKWDEIPEIALNYWMNNYISVAPPKGESLNDLVARCKDFLDTLPNIRKILVVTHAGVIRCFLHLLNQMPLEQIMREQIHFGQVYKFQRF